MHLSLYHSLLLGESFKFQSSLTEVNFQIHTVTAMQLLIFFDTSTPGSVLLIRG